MDIREELSCRLKFPRTIGGGGPAARRGLSRGPRRCICSCVVAVPDPRLVHGRSGIGVSEVPRTIRVIIVREICHDAFNPQPDRNLRFGGLRDQRRGLVSSGNAPGLSVGGSTTWSGRPVLVLLAREFLPLRIELLPRLLGVSVGAPQERFFGIGVQTDGIEEVILRQPVVKLPGVGEVLPKPLVRAEWLSVRAVVRHVSLPLVTGDAGGSETARDRSSAPYSTRSPPNSPS